MRIRRLKIGNKNFEQKLEPITDTATIAVLANTYARKYEYKKGDGD